MEKRYDFIIIGSGIAGLFFAHKVSGLMPDAKIAIITKKSETESNTNYAQGGIATVMSSIDSFKMHIEDTLTAGAGLCRRDVVEQIIQYGPEIIKKLVNIGVHFTKRGKSFDLGREGGHTTNRVVHAADLTGREIERALLTACRRRKNIDIYRDTIALDLITYQWHGRNRCGGVYAYSERKNDLTGFYAPVTMLATGGIGQVYYHTTNPKIATGDGIAMAYRAGARVANLEFVQFHPTTLYSPGKKPFLISEAVRGEGGILTNSAGKKFMRGYHPLKDLAPRDIVARAIDTELKRTGDRFVLLDISHRGAAFVKKRFPNIYGECLKRGMDISKEPIPVVPSAHYVCGGVMADLRGRTDIDGLYVCGESACTGMHGANRLASNSLLEAVVMSDYAADAAVLFRQSHIFPDSPPSKIWLHSTIDGIKDKIIISHDRTEVRRLMSDYLGIVRSSERLKMVHERVKVILKAIDSYYLGNPVSYEIVELRNIALVAELVIRCAKRRKESRGLHWIIDYPETDDKHWKRDTIIKPPGFVSNRRKHGSSR